MVRRRPRLDRSETVQVCFLLHKRKSPTGPCGSVILPTHAKHQRGMAEVSSLIAPHGGTLVDRVVPTESRHESVDRAGSLPRVVLSVREASDLEMIAIGGFSPLGGFLRQNDYASVVDDMHLVGGPAWSLPITLSVTSDDASSIEKAGGAALVSEAGGLLAILDGPEAYSYDKQREAERVFGTTDEAHPGVAQLYGQQELLVGGDVHVLDFAPRESFEVAELPPSASRAAFEERGWKSVVAFQTRNPIHRAHEYIIRTALEIVDGLFVHPLIGWTQKGDIPADVRMQCYQVLLDRYFPAERVVLGSLPAAMRYAGPREAVHHALVRKNYGCSHFIVGRDHAGVGDYYGTYDAQLIFDRFEEDEIGITPLRFEHSFYCQRTGGMATTKTSPAGPEERLFLSGTKLRQILSEGELPPPEITRPEVAELLFEWAKGTDE